MKFAAPVFDAMPKPLTEAPHWVMWREVMKPLAVKPSKLPFTVWGTSASTTDPQTWNSFEAVKAAYWAGGFDGVGFVFKEGGNLSGIDLDDPNGDQDKIELFNRITEKFVTYTENSPSGKGVHIITFGEVESGKRRDGVEVYSAGRFFTMTGNLTFWHIPEKREVRDCRAYLEILWRQLGGANAAGVMPIPVSKPERVNDADLIRELEALPHAGELFKALMRGEREHHNNDHSAADQALCNIIANSTDNLEQAERIWRGSKLASRPKVQPS
jgi:putative DNA primase/helicase